MIHSFAIFKNDKATGNQPQYRMVGKPDNAGKDVKSVDLAGLWLKEYNGNKYYSGKLNSEFKKEDGSVKPGYVIITEEEYNQLLKGADIMSEAEDNDADEIPF